MKTKIIAIVLLASTAAAVAYHPLHSQPGSATVGHTTRVEPLDVGAVVAERQRIEVVFALDTTGSMGGLIEAAKEKIWSIASTMASAQNAPEIRIGLVAYRDRGDAYVTRVVDLSPDLDSMYATLMEFQAAGGGDGPESVNAALRDAIHSMSWSQDSSTYKVVFLVGDAPPHMDYQDEVSYPQTLAEAASHGIVVNTIQCGTSHATERTWQQIAQLGTGRYLRVDQAGSAVAIATPFDEKIAVLSAELDDTRLYYGSDEEKARKRQKVAASDKVRALSSLASQARRAIFNVSDSGEVNLYGDGELVEDVAAGKVDLDALEVADLPAPIAAMEPEMRGAALAQIVDRRGELKAEIEVLAKERSDYLEREVRAIGGAKDSLDQQLYETVREQAAKKGLRYESATPRY